MGGGVGEGMSFCRGPDEAREVDCLWGGLIRYRLKKWGKWSGFVVSSQQRVCFSHVHP